ncbi:amino acid ABC transporter permease [Tabrizicola sp.]|uniref:amino acid ABC transporter permease n=1 Tax=Tabrizicola sp. TaxID=2005166 RepID=UPI0035B2129C
MDQHFSRSEMLPPLAPPITERGAVKWMRENLFSTPLNAILTLLGLAAIYALVAASLPWWLNSVWNAESLGQCRDIVTATAGEGATGACWAMIRERWHQFLFGFYPPDQWWRPILALGLLFVALAPVLFAGQKRNMAFLLGGIAVYLVVTLTLAETPAAAFALAVALVLGLTALSQVQPGRLLWFTAIYPALCFWLLWGGSVWVPALTLVGLAAAVFFAFGNPLKLGSPWPFLGAVLIFLVVFLDPISSILDLAGWIGGFFTESGVRLDLGATIGDVRYSIRDIFPLLPHGIGEMDSLAPIGLKAINSDLFGGFLLAIVIGVTGIAFSLPIGILLALGRQSDMLIVKTLSVGFIEFVRGVPLITLLFTASLLLQYFLPPGTNFDIILRVIILVTFFAAAYLAEVIRGGLAALPRGQYEAADALGLDYWRAQRLIILPQALKVSIPAIVSTFIGLFKDTTLVAFVGLMDPLKGVTQIVRADIDWKGIYWEPYIFVGAIFFIICFGMSRYSMYLEKKLKTDHR